MLTGVVTAGYCEGERRGVIGKQEGGQGDIVNYCVIQLLRTPDTRQGIVRKFLSTEIEMKTC